MNSTAWRSLWKAMRLACVLVLAWPAVSAGEDRPAAQGGAIGPSGQSTPPPKRKKSAAEQAAEEAEGVDDTPATSGGTYVMPAVRGTWQSAGRTLTIKPSGEYTISGSGADSGKISAWLGRLSRTSEKTGKNIRGTFKLHSLTMLETEEPSGRTEWRRVP